jgi:hypothetical protein
MPVLRSTFHGSFRRSEAFVYGALARLALLSASKVAERAQQREVQAIFLLNLMRFIKWPEKAFATEGAAFVIGTLPDYGQPSQSRARSISTPTAARTALVILPLMPATSRIASWQHVSPESLASFRFPRQIVHVVTHQTIRRLLGSVAIALALTARTKAQSADHLKLINVAAENVIYREVSSVRLIQSLGATKANYDTLALVKSHDFQNGTIELDLAGALQPNVPEFGNGFLGVAFHVQSEAESYEMFYLRPNNARAPDQLRRNHTTQYVSHPGWSWERTRKETPGLYESYVDMEVGAWTKVRIVVAGSKAELYLNGAAQPCLIVNDLKLGSRKGAIGLWVGSGAQGYFANLRVTPARPAP